MKISYPNIPECHYRVSAKAIVRNEEGNFLLCLDDSGYWDFPGGGIDHGEDIYEALAREVKEEMGISITKSSPQPIYCYVAQSTKGNQPVCIICYDSTLEHYNFTPSDECREIGFFDSQMCKDLKTYIQNKDIITYLEKRVV